MVGYRCLDDFVVNFKVTGWWLDYNSEGFGGRVLALGSYAGNLGIGDNGRILDSSGRGNWLIMDSRWILGSSKWRMVDGWEILGVDSVGYMGLIGWGRCLVRGTRVGCGLIDSGGFGSGGSGNSGE
ncbi:hypothetical protein HAX54_003640 [Datura stramonium]|uniref:Uncharacterized protein n=1 Tax=Datura stramonium TaxID=4076 RepID=A0ABS8WVD3_DATST|nr:hypothetical protein [Datura stramonium]